MASPASPDVSLSSKTRNFNRSSTADVLSQCGATRADGDDATQENNSTGTAVKRAASEVTAGVVGIGCFERLAFS